jgi:hypothetical protein
VSARVHRVEPLERGHARTRGVSHRLLHGLHSGGDVRHQALARVGIARRLREPGKVGQDLAKGGGVERDHLRAGGQALGHGLHVIERHGTHRAHGLGHDQVHAEPGEHLLVELVQRLAPAGALAYGVVDLAGGEALADHAAGEMGQSLRARRIITLVGHPGHGIAEPEGEEHLGGRGDK